MHEELQCIATRFSRLRAIGEHAPLRLDRRDQALAIGTVARRVEGADTGRRVAIVPTRRRLEACRIKPAQMIGPRSDTGQRRIGFTTQQLGNLGLRRRRQLAFGDRTDELVPEVTPGVRREARSQQQPNGHHIRYPRHT